MQKEIVIDRKQIEKAGKKRAIIFSIVLSSLLIVFINVFYGIRNGGVTVVLELKWCLTTILFGLVVYLFIKKASVEQETSDRSFDYVEKYLDGIHYKKIMPLDTFYCKKLSSFLSTNLYDFVQKGEIELWAIISSEDLQNVLIYYSSKNKIDKVFLDEIFIGDFIKYYCIVG